MNQMFEGATSFNRDLSKWDVSKVTTMWGMFNGASSFNRDLSKWDVSSVTTMASMFKGATSFAQTLCGTRWTESKADKNGMFTNSKGKFCGGFFKSFKITWNKQEEGDCRWQCTCKVTQNGCNSENRCKRYVWSPNTKLCKLFANEGIRRGLGLRLGLGLGLGQAANKADLKTDQPANRPTHLILTLTSHNPTKP